MLRLCARVCFVRVCLASAFGVRCCRWWCCSACRCTLSSPRPIKHTPTHTQPPTSGVVEEVEGLDDGSHSRWARPVRCRVGGGFTISRLAGAAGAADSPECLVTLVLNVGG